MTVQDGENTIAEQDDLETVIDINGEPIDYILGGDYMAEDYTIAKRKARELLLELLTEKEREAFELNGGSIVVLGKKYDYTIHPWSQTEVHTKNGALKAYACLVTTIPCPVYDRMIAEYIMIKNDEELYRRTANWFHTRHNATRQFVFNLALSFATFWILYHLIRLVLHQ